MATTMNSNQRTFFFVADVQDDRILIDRIGEGPIEPDPSLGAIPLEDIVTPSRKIKSWAILCAKADYPFLELLVRLRNMGMPFLNAGPGWHPGGHFMLYREKGKVQGNISTIEFLVDGTFRIKDNQ